MTRAKQYPVTGAPFKGVLTIPSIEKYLEGYGAQSDTRVAIPAFMLRSIRLSHAIKRGAQDHVVIVNEGGLGDRVCAEPTLRRVLREFKCKVSLMTPDHELFSHLEFFDRYTRARQPDWAKVTKFEIMPPDGDIFQDFYVHKEMHCVDYASTRIFRGTIADPKEREIWLPEFTVEHSGAEYALDLAERAVIVHAGRTWPSRTLPKSWWDAVLAELRRAGFTPVLIGRDGKETGTVDVDTTGCLDLRNLLSLKDMVSVLTRARYVLSNDSAPIHIAAAGQAFIGFVTTVRHPGYLMHWRNGEFGWRTRNFGRDGLWNHRAAWPPPSPDYVEDIKVIPDELMERILPEPAKVAEEYCR